MVSVIILIALQHLGGPLGDISEIAIIDRDMARETSVDDELFVLGGLPERGSFSFLSEDLLLVHSKEGAALLEKAEDDHVWHSRSLPSGRYAESGPAGKLVFVSDDNDLIVFDLDTGQTTLVAKVSRNVWGIVYVPSARIVIARHSNALTIYSLDTETAPVALSMQDVISDVLPGTDLRNKSVRIDKVHVAAEVGVVVVDAGGYDGPKHFVFDPVKASWTALPFVGHGIVTVSASGQIYWFKYEEGDLWVSDLKGRELRTVPAMYEAYEDHRSLGCDVAISADDRVLALSSGRFEGEDLESGQDNFVTHEVWLVGASSSLFKSTYPYSFGDKPVSTSLAVSPRGRYLCWEMEPGVVAIARIKS